MRAYKKAYDEFGGGVPWSDLFQPTIQLCRNGFVISPSQAAAIRQIAPFIYEDPSLKFVYARFAEMSKATVLFF